MATYLTEPFLLGLTFLASVKVFVLGLPGFGSHELWIFFLADLPLRFVTVVAHVQSPISPDEQLPEVLMQRPKLPPLALVMSMQSMYLLLGQPELGLPAVTATMCGA